MICLIKLYILPAVIFTGFFADLVFGDPQNFPHPVRIIGLFSKKLEPLFKRNIHNERVSGILFAATVITTSAAATALIICPLFFAGSGLNLTTDYILVCLSLLISSYFIYTTLAIKDLRVESMRVYENLKSGKIEDARFSLSRIVSRDTAGLDEKNIVRATVETIAENSVDGILSPLFYAFIGGPVLAITFKAISTLDSMFGYKTEKYKDFGMASAKIDDAANFIPARLSALLLPLSSLLCGKGFFKPLRITMKFRKNNPSPNSGIPEAAIAGALGIRLGGESHYGGKISVKPYIGVKAKEFEKEDIGEALKIVYVFSFLSILLLMLAYSLLAYLVVRVFY